MTTEEKFGDLLFHSLTGGLEPVYTNPEGYSYYYEVEMQKRAKELDCNAYIITKEGTTEMQSRLVQCRKTGEVLYENTSLEGVAVFLDMMKARNRFS